MSKIYTANVKAHGGREGKSETTDGRLSFDLAKPGSTKAGTTNPEELFASGYAACFAGAIDHIAKQHGVENPNAVVEADVGLNKVGDGLFLNVDFRVTLPDVETENAEKIVEEAHQFCPYSKAVKNNVDVNISINGNTLSKAA